MNCTRVLQLLAPRRAAPSPIMPVDMAVRICLSGSPPLRSFLGNYDDRCSPSSAAALLRRCEPLRPCLSSHVTMETKTSPSAAPEIDGGGGGDDGRTRRKKKKKKVVFADSQGLALTAVHVFDESEDDALSELQFHLTEIEGATAALQLGGNKDLTDCGAALVLDFPQPAADYLDLRNRLKAQQVCLETCSLRDRLLSGTVQVRNVCFRKSVSVRITFDRWRSFHDVPCRYLNNVYGCPDTDTFSFSVSLPEEERRESSSSSGGSGVEFCVQFQTEDRVFWDNNGGNNYRLAAADGSENNTEIQGDRGGGGGGGEPSQTEFGPFGSPRTSAGIFPEWQSWSRVETPAPYW